MSAVAPSSPLVGPSDQAGMLQQLDDRLKALEQTSVVSVGVTAFCPGAVPNGWLALDGSVIDANRYGQLAAYLGTTTLPDVRGRVIVGKAAAGTFSGLLGFGGAETVLLTAAQSALPTHTHPGGGATGTQSANHTHQPGDLSSFATTGFTAQVAAGGSFAAVNNAIGTTSVENTTHTHADPVTGSAGGTGASAAHTNLQPYIVLIPIIKF